MGKSKISSVGLIKPTDKAHQFAGPIRFKQPCENCGKPRNKHCGRCKACPGYQVRGCVDGFAGNLH